MFSWVFDYNYECKQDYIMCVLAGAGDRVLCFHCGGGVKSWQRGEDPWEEHAKHYPG